jgi:hypothetical protein
MVMFRQQVLSFAVDRRPEILADRFALVAPLSGA